DASQDRKYRSNRNVDIDIRGPVQRIEEKDVLSTFVVRRNFEDTLVLFAGHSAEVPAVVHRAIDHGVGEGVEFLDDLALNINVPRRAERIDEPRLPDLAIDNFKRQRQV